MFSENTYSQFIRFCLIGVLNTTIDLALYYVLTRYLDFSGNLIFLAKGVSSLIATFNSFIWNRLWTFQKGLVFNWSEVVTFYSVVGTGIFINLGVHYINTALLGLNDLLSAFISAGFTALWGFGLAKYIVFK